MKAIAFCIASVAILCSSEGFTQGTSQVDMVRACNSDPAAQGLTGNARKNFMTKCLQTRSAAAPPLIGPGRAAALIESAPAKEAAAKLLKDPSTAQFRNLTFHEKSRAICGEINGKNSYGGYVGFRPFAYVDGRAIVMPSSGDLSPRLDAEKAIRKACE